MVFAGLTRRILIGIVARALLGVGAATLIWRSRIIQVVVFLTSARLRHSSGSAGRVGPAARAVEWSTLSALSPPEVGLNKSVLITYHPEYHLFDPQRAIESLEMTRQLSIGWLRTDIRWNELMPDGSNCDPKTAVWYHSFLSSAQKVGLRNMLVLSSPPAVVIEQSIPDRLISWNRFVTTVVSEFEDLCNVYQLMNEPNNPAYRFFPHLEDTAQAFTDGASIIRATAPKAYIAINIMMDIWGWRQYLEKILALSGSALDIVGLDHYPGTWTIGIHERWKQIEELADLIASAPADSLWFNRHLMIMETGFTTNSMFRGQAQQSQYFEHTVKASKELKRHMADDLPLLGIYELCDGDSSAGLDPEAHFGLLTADLKQKVAFRTVQTQVKIF